MENEDIDSILAEFERRYREEDDSFIDEITNPFYIREDGFAEFAGKTIHDYFSLSIDPSDSSKKRTIDVSLLENIVYALLPKKIKEHYLKKLNKKYLKKKDHLLETLVTSEKIAAIDSRTKRTEREVFNIKRSLDPYEHYESELKHNLENFKPKRIILGFDDSNYGKDSLDPLREMVESVFSDITCMEMESVPLVYLECDENSTEKILSFIKNNEKGFEGMFAEPESLVYIPELFMKKKKEEKHEMLWNLRNIEVEKAHTITRGNNVKVGIIDTGVDYTHPEVASCFQPIKGYNFVKNNHDPMDRDSHGTHVAGTVAGTRTGVAPEATLFALKVLGDDGRGSSFNVLRGVEWAARNNLDVINLSLGGGKYSKAAQKVYTHAFSKGLCIVAAAGNDGNSRLHYPASYDNVIAVPAVNRFNKRASFSNTNNMNDLAAPGVGIYSSIPNGGYTFYSGTSMACPHVSGVCALMKAVKSKDPERIERRLKENAKKLGSKKKFGAGLIQAYAGLR